MVALLPEFSRFVTVTRISPSGAEEVLTAKPSERAALAKRFDLIEITTLVAQLTLLLGPRQSITATGTIHADVTQRCVVTLEPITNAIDLNVDIVFVPAGQRHEASGVPQSDDLEAEIEFYDNGKIDLGEMVAQHLGVNLDPYPRKENAALVTTEFGTTRDKGRPLAQLAVLAKKKENKDKTKD